jgi:hypothetical protein
MILMMKARVLIGQKGVAVEDVLVPITILHQLRPGGQPGQQEKSMVSVRSR